HSPPAPSLIRHLSSSARNMQAQSSRGTPLTDGRFIRFTPKDYDATALDRASAASLEMTPIVAHQDVGGPPSGFLLGARRRRAPGRAADAVWLPRARRVGSLRGGSSSGSDSTFCARKIAASSL